MPLLEQCRLVAHSPLIFMFEITCVSIVTVNREGHGAPAPMIFIVVVTVFPHHRRGHWIVFTPSLWLIAFLQVSVDQRRSFFLEKKFCELNH